MALSRWFLNLIVQNSITGSKSLRRIDLTLHNFFDANECYVSHKNTMDTIHQLPSPIFKLDDEQKKMNCFPLADGKVICADHLERSFLFDADTRRVVTLPHLHAPKSKPISLFADGDGDVSSRLYIMERRPEWGGVGEQSDGGIRQLQPRKKHHQEVMGNPAPPAAAICVRFSVLAPRAVLGDRFLC
uniref:Uncharacterized protein n=1 Tax=Leersia perrieri TaxID=77586 RepID=A0A0D9VA13_9ORYZ